MDAESALNYGDPASAALNGNAFSQYKSAIGKEHAEIQPEIDKLKATADQPKPAVPDQTPVEKAPKSEDFQKTSAGWMNAMAIFAAVAGAKSRQHATTAFTAFAAGMKGLKEGQQQDFENHYKTWEGDTKAALDNNKMLMDKYKAVQDDRSLTESEQQMKIKMIAYEHQDEIMMAAENFHQQMAITAAKAKAETGVETYFEKLQAKNEESLKEQSDQIEKYKADPSMPTLADAFHSGVPITTLVKGLGKDAQAKAQAIQDLASEKYGDFDWATQHNKYMAQGSELKGMGSMAGKIELGGSLLEKSIPSMLAAAKKVGLTESTDLNTLYNTAKRHLSNQDFQNFATQLRATTSDYALFLGRGRQTVHSDQEALRILSDDMGVTSLQGFSDAVNTERANTTAAINESLGRTPPVGGVAAPAGGTGWKIEPVK